MPPSETWSPLPSGAFLDGRDMDDGGAEFRLLARDMLLLRHSLARRRAPRGLARPVLPARSHVPAR